MIDFESLHGHLNKETARASWAELERFFASGSILWVAPALDLVAVAAAMASDRKEVFEAWLQAGQVVRLADERARTWSETAPELWAVVVAPWVLVQEAAA